METSQRYAIAYDEARNRLTWRMGGFWRIEDVGQFAADLRRAIPGTADMRSVDCLADAREFPVQSPDVVTALNKDAALLARRMAIVAGTMLNKIQAQRMVPPHIRIFLSIESAEAWLDQPPPAAES